MTITIEIASGELEATRTYFFRIRAVAKDPTDDKGYKDSPWSTTVEYAPGERPNVDAPTNLSATTAAGTGGQITAILTWTRPSARANIGSYKIHYCPVSDCSEFTNVSGSGTNVPSRDATTLTTSPFTPGDACYFRIKSESRRTTHKNSLWSPILTCELPQ